jgi:MATE family multidrug resistance protein
MAVTPTNREPSGLSSPTEITLIPAAAMSLGLHIGQTVRLALPVMLSRAGLVIMIAIDTFLCRGSKLELAFFGGSVQPQSILQSTGVGLLIGTIVLCAQADGAGDRHHCGGLWRLSMLVAGVLGFAYAAILAFGEPLMRLLGQPADIAAGSGAALRYFAIGMPGLMLFFACNFFLEGISRPWPSTVIMLAGNIVNFLIAWPLADGNFGLPALGASGAALATSLTRWVMFAAVLIYILRLPDRAAFGIGTGAKWQPGDLRRLLALGVPLGFAIALESSCFMSMIVMAGWLGATSLATMHAAINVTSLVYMLTIGLATAAAIRVANAIGRGSWRDAAKAGWVSVGLEVAVMACVAAIIFCGAALIAEGYSSDAEVLALLTPVLTVTAAMIIIDGMQGVLMGVLRGTSDTLIPTIIYGLSFWAIGVPIGYIFGFRQGIGPMALMSGLAVSLTIAMTMLAWRFHVLMKRKIEQHEQRV